MDDTPVQRPERTAMLAALKRLVLAESPSLDKARCDACADEVAELSGSGSGSGRSGIDGPPQAITSRSVSATGPSRS